MWQEISQHGSLFQAKTGSKAATRPHAPCSNNMSLQQRQTPHATDKLAEVKCKKQNNTSSCTNLNRRLFNMIAVHVFTIIMLNHGSTSRPIGFRKLLRQSAVLAEAHSLEIYVLDFSMKGKCDSLSGEQVQHQRKHQRVRHLNFHRALIYSMLRVEICSFSACPVEQSARARWNLHVKGVMVMSP